MQHIEPLVPGYRNRLDIALGWISEYRRDWEERLAGVEVERLEIEQTCIHVAALAETMEHAPIEHRRAMIAAIRAELRDIGLWPPELEGTEPTA